MTINMEHELDSEDLLDEAASSQYDLSFELNRTKKIIGDLKLDGQFINTSFSDDLWIIADKRNLDIGHKTSFDFSPLEPLVFQSNLKLNIKKLVKCWVAHLIEDYTAMTVSKNLNYIIDVLTLSHGFDSTYIEEFKAAMDSMTIESRKDKLISTALNFVDYAQMEDPSSYSPVLRELREGTNYRGKARTLPSSLFVLQFEYYLDKYFMEVTVDTLEDYYLRILAFPILLWWRLSNIIPMRPSEFCLIKRDCLDYKNDAIYLSLPRTKLRGEMGKKRKTTVQNYDTVEIDKEMADLISFYQTLTEGFGTTKTLVSWRSLEAVDNTNRTSKANRDYFTLRILNQLLTRFYESVLDGKCGISIEKGKRIRPGDTRHFAFINLMMTGVSPVEVARLGGHSTIRAQLHYSHHVEYWIDSSVNKLLEKQKLAFADKKKSLDAYIPSFVITRTIKKGTTDSRLPLEIGYCSDRDQQCETNDPKISGCIFHCRHWRIEHEELVEKRELIIRLVAEKKSNIHELYAFMTSLHEKIFKTEFNNHKLAILTNIKTTANKINQEIETLASFKANPFGGGVILSASA